MNTTDPDGGSTRLTIFMRARKTRVIGITALAFFIIYSIIGFFVLPYFIKKIGMEKLSDLSGRRVIIESVSVNPYTLSVTILGFEIREKDGQTPFISFNRLYANAEVISLFKGGPVIREIKLEKPHVHLVRMDDNSYNFSDMIDRFLAKPQTGVPEKPGKPFVFSFSNIQIHNGDITFDDRPVATKHDITQINLAIPFISNLPTYVDSFVQPLLSASINGTPLNIKGISKVFADSHETSLDIDLKDIDIPYYLAYAPATLNVKVPSGRLDVQLKATYRQYTNRAPMIVLTGKSTVRDLIVKMNKARDEFFKVPLFSIQDVSFDFEARKIEVNAVSTSKGLVAISRAANGRMNYDSLMNPASSPAPKKPAAVADAAPWIYSLKSFAIDDYTVTVTDNVPAEPFGITIDKINCAVRNITTEKSSRGTVALSLRVDQQGSFSLDGEVALDPLSADLAVNLKDLRIKSVQPYLAEQAQVILAGGALNMSGKLTVRKAANENLDAALKGRIRLSKFSLLDKANTDDLLKWDSLSVESLDVRYSPLSVHIKEIALSNFYSRIFINADRTINLQEIFKSPVPAEVAGGPQRETPPAMALVSEPSQTSGQQPDIRIDTITLKGGTINFTDDSVKPRFNSNIFDLAGHVTGLSSKKDATGEVELKGSYDRYAPLEINGKVNPYKDNLFVDLKVDFKDMDLTSVSPYAARYAGYTIEKGKLSFRLEYLVEKNKLNAKNNVFLDQFNFGDKVESPEATKLPVRLAVSLLKDRKGEIRLDIPVSGELSDPKFSIGGLILKVIVNLLVKAATSPFALLGAVFGGGDQLSYAEFDYGSAALTEASIKKLDILEKALNDRPALKMDIEGHTDPEKDREGLKQGLMLKRIRAQKVREQAKTDDTASSLESLVVTPEEYPEYLRRAYKAEKFPKPRNIIGIAKDLPVPEMEKLMLANMTVTDDDLKGLAAERARAVRDYLLQSKQVEPERVFMIESKTLEGEKIEGAGNSRADFKLK